MTTTEAANDLSEEDAKLVALAKQARARIQASEGAAVRDETGRSYSGATVDLPSTHLSALQLAVAQAVAAGARDIEAAVVVTNNENIDTEPIADAASTPTPLHICSPKRDVTSSTIVES
jgi:cytidine deaminase